MKVSKTSSTQLSFLGFLFASFYCRKSREFYKAKSILFSFSSSTSNLRSLVLLDFLLGRLTFSKYYDELISEKDKSESCLISSCGNNALDIRPFATKNYRSSGYFYFIRSANEFSKLATLLLDDSGLSDILIDRNDCLIEDF